MGVYLFLSAFVDHPIVSPQKMQQFLYRFEHHYLFYLFNLKGKVHRECPNDSQGMNAQTPNHINSRTAETAVTISILV